MKIYKQKNSSEVDIDEMLRIIEQHIITKLKDDHCDNKPEILRGGIKQIVQLRFHKEILDEAVADSWTKYIESAIEILNDYITCELDSVWECYRKYKEGSMSKQELIGLVNKNINIMVSIKIFMFELGKFNV